MNTTDWTYEDWYEYYYDLAISRGDGEDYAAAYADTQAHYQTSFQN